MPHNHTVKIAALLIGLNTGLSLAEVNHVPKGTWFPSGLDIIRDPVTGRLAVPEHYGEALISGSANTPVIRQDPLTKNALLYIGASNGGVYLRRYTYAEDRWSDGWTWVSKPGSGYTGSQSIGALSISPDGQLLAVGQGNPSNYNGFGVPGNGIQIGRIQPDGTLHWVETDPGIAPILRYLNVRSLSWTGGNTVCPECWVLSSSTLNIDNGRYLGSRLLALLVPDGTIALLQRGAFDSWNLTTDTVRSLSSSPVLVAGYNTMDFSPAYLNQVGILQRDGSVVALGGDRYGTYLQSLYLQQLKIARISVYPQLVNGTIVAFIGSYDGKDDISRIDRLVIDPVTYALMDVSTAPVQGKIGNSQAANLKYYGNFSLSANPLDPGALTVFSGGNQYADDKAFTYAGGLVSVGFGSTPGVTDYLYGPLKNSGGEADGAQPGAPHADSRTIAYYDTPHGPALIQSDDGGIWQLGLDGNSWWKSLTAAGLNTLEVMTSDWNSTTKSLVAAYQDNAASLGSFGQPSSHNLLSGDGQIAFFDDGGPLGVQGLTDAYFQAQEYLGSENSGLIRSALNKSGFITSYDMVHMFLRWDEQRIPFAEWLAFKAQGLGVPFQAPIAPNAYRPGDIVMAGRFNVYETIPVDAMDLPNSLVFEPLFDFNVNPLQDPERLDTYWVNALDNQGSALPQSRYDSLYTGLQILDADAKLKFSGIYGRQRGDEMKLEPIYQMQGTADGSILAIAHRSAENQKDAVYWLQGGTPIRNNDNSKGAFLPEQSLRARLPNGQVKAYTLDSLGILLSPVDAFKLQSLVYVPAVNGHGEYLVVGGQQGAWMAAVNPATGEPGSFTPMNWRDLPDSTPPGSYNVTMKYDPKDDLLVASQLGQGSWLYSFSGQIEPKKPSDQLINMPRTVLLQQARPALDKRGNQVNTLLFVQLNPEMINPGQAYDVIVEFRDFKKWQDTLELLSPIAGAVGKSPPDFNLLTEAGQARFHAVTGSNGTLRVPVHLEPGINMMAFTINGKEVPEFVPTFSLELSTSLADSSNAVISHLIFDSGSPAYSVYIPGALDSLDPYSPSFDPHGDDGLQRFHYRKNRWVVGPVKHVAKAGYSDNDVVYVGTEGNKVKAGRGNDLIYVDGSTAGVNKLFGGPGANQFRLVSTLDDLPSFPQQVMDFKPGKDKVGLAGVSYKDLTFKQTSQGAALFVLGQEVGQFRHISKRVLKNPRNFIFYN